MKHIILDTNILMAISQFKIDIFSELARICDFPYTISILDKTVEELNKIKATQNQTQSRAAKLALQIIKKYKIKIIKTNSKQSVDKLLIDFSKEDYIIATQDRNLKKQLKKPLITIRKRKYLTII